MVSSNDIQRLFLQAVLSRGVLSDKLALIIWSKCKEAVKAADETLDISADNSNAAWEDFVAKVNVSIDALDLEFKHLQDEETGREMYALINRKGDPIAQMATDYSPPEIAFFKAIVEQIMLAPREAYSVSSLGALREVNSLKTNMTKTQAEIVLGSFVAKGWLLKSRRGRYSLSTRTLIELGKYLKETYGDDTVLECTICFEILTRGIACHIPNCKTRLHYHCFKHHRRLQSSCPSCKQDWPQEVNSKPLVPVGEGAVREGDDTGRRSRRDDTADGSDEDEIDDDEPSQASQPASTQTQKKKGKPSTASMDVDDSEEEDYAPPMTNGRRRSAR